MKKMILVLAMLLTLAACAEAWTAAQNPPEVGNAMPTAVEPTQLEDTDARTAPNPENLDLSSVIGNGKAVSVPALPDEDAMDAEAAEIAATQSETTESLPENQEDKNVEEHPVTQEPPAATEPTSVPETPPQPEPQPTAAPAPTAYGAIPFELAASTGTWWKIDATDSAYWAVQENINAMRAAGGLPALSIDDSLSGIASTRCESFVLGGPFDHSGMVTRSEICAAGPLGSASAVCAAWQASEAHYANIMRSDVSRMGVGCWFCEMDGNRYTYWTVTFE